MAQHQYIEEPSLELKNSLSSISFQNYKDFGKQAELWFSSHTRLQSMPFLISPLLSKKLGIKQIDFSELHHLGLILWEVKSCFENEELAIMRASSFLEKSKWKKTALILSELLSLKVSVHIAVIRYQNGFNFVKNHKLV